MSILQADVTIRPGSSDDWGASVPLLVVSVLGGATGVGVVLGLDEKRSRWMKSMRAQRAAM